MHAGIPFFLRVSLAVGLGVAGAACSSGPTAGPVTATESESTADAQIAQAPSPAATRAAATQPANHDFARWEKEIAAFEAQDREHPPARGGVLFIGSSTIRLWKTLARDFPRHHVINRGFGGSQIVDATHFAERIIFPYEPGVIFLRSGGNDIHAGKTPEQVFAEYRAFVVKVHKRLPRTQIVYISLCPAPARWAERDANRRLNTLIGEYARRRPYLKYVETYDMTLGPNGEAREELFVEDRLHLNAEGYRLLAERVRPFMPPLNP